MTWHSGLRVLERVGIKSGLTQDKSNCVLRPQIANGDGALARVTSVTHVTREYLGISRHYCEYARVGFVHELVHSWRLLATHLNSDGCVQGAKWCKP